MRLFWTISVAAGVIGGATGPSSAEQAEAWRVFVSDHSAPRVTVVDAMQGRAIATFATRGPATLYRNDAGSAVYAVQGTANTVAAIATGISFDDHGDHGDIRIEEPILTGAEIVGDHPVHFVQHHDQWAAFFDREGVARVFSDREAREGEVVIREVDAGAPHHGVVVAYGDHDLVSVPHPQDPSELPVGIRVQDRSGAQVGDIADCPDLHGEASSGNLLLFACETGLLVVKDAGGTPEITHLAYPSSLPKGKSTTVVGGRGMQYFLGNYGPDKVVLIDPAAGDDAFRMIDLPMRRVHFAVDPVRPKFAYVFTEDGRLHRIDVLAGELNASLALTEPYSMDGHWSDPRPRIAVAGDSVVVSDPLNGRLHLVSASDFTRTGEIAVEGAPFNVVAVGGSGTVHDHADVHPHAHDGSAEAERIYQGYFEDAQVRDRALTDWAGDWQSVYPYLKDGTLEPVMAHKAEHGEMSAEEYTAYYDIGYKTDVERITIDGDTVTFFADGKPLKARYASDGHEILTYKKGNRGVRFIFSKVEGDADAPQYIQFSDHKIAPETADHYHLYWGNDRAALLEEVTNWPTYYPSSLSADEIVREMIAH